MAQRPSAHFRLKSEEVQSLSLLAGEFGCYKPWYTENVPNVTALLRLIAVRQVFCLGPAERKDFRFLADALVIILKHSELFLNGLQGADRTQAQDFLGKVQAQIKWQLGEK